MADKLEEIEDEIKLIAEKWRPTAALMYYTYYHGIYKLKFSRIDDWLKSLAERIDQSVTWCYSLYGAGRFLFNDICPHLNISFNPESRSNLMSVLNNSFPHAAAKNVYIASACYKHYVKLEEKGAGLELGVRAATGKIDRSELEEIRKELVRRSKGLTVESEELSGELEEELEDQENSGTSSASQKSGSPMVHMANVKEACKQIGINELVGLRFLKKLNIKITT